jgi:hypothetical protein
MIGPLAAAGVLDIRERTIMSASGRAFSYAAGPGLAASALDGYA